MLVRMAVMVKQAVTRSEICCWSKSERDFHTRIGNSVMDWREGFSQRVATKSVRRATLAVASTVANSRERNVFSSTNLQLTVHLYRNTRENSKARER